ncbi:MAG: kelch repeat-containing protein [Tepidisphaeraceae bacterium]
MFETLEARRLLAGDDLVVSGVAPASGQTWTEGKTIVAAPAPVAPGKLKARPISTTTNALKWSDRSSDETGFRIERKRGSLGKYMPIAWLDAGVTSFVDAQLRPGTKYTYRVRAFNATAETASSPSPSDPARTFDRSGASIVWEQIAPAPIPRAEAMTATVDGKLYVFGGFSGSAGPVVRSDVYDPVTNTWTRIADLPKRITHAGVAVDGRNIYLAGGYVGTGPGFQQQFGTNEVWRFNVDAQQWTAMPALPADLASGGLVVLGRELHYFGGNDAARDDVGVHYVLSLDAPTTWASAAALPSGRSHLGYAALGGKIYAMGGQFGIDEDLETENLVHVWDPASPGAWAALATMPAKVSHISSSTFVHGDRIIVAGGETANGAATKGVFAYDPLANDWDTLTSLPAPRFSGAARAIDGVLYFTGGSSQTTTYRGVFAA